jgi:hypothetical protein
MLLFNSFNSFIYVFNYSFRDNYLKHDRVFDKKMKICSTIGACAKVDFEFSTEPKQTDQDQWDSKCHVCQAFANDLEERILLISKNYILFIINLLFKFINFLLIYLFFIYRTILVGLFNKPSNF